MNTALHRVHWMRQDDETTQPDPEVMRVTREAAFSATGRLMLQLKAKGHHEGEDTFEKRLAIAKQLKVGCFVLEIDGESPVFAGLAGLFLHGLPSGHWVFAAYDTTWG